MSDNCIFCKIMNGEIPSNVVYENEKFKVILDRFPSAKGHMLVVPKQHFENIHEMPEEHLSELMLLVKKMANELNEKYNPDGINILQNNGKAAGQSVFHFHMHIIPRYSNDDIKIGWSALQFTDEEIKSHCEELRID